MLCFSVKCASPEWKIDKDSPTDTHRHLSHLIGLYPGYALTSYNASLQGGTLVNGTLMTYNKEEIINATTVSLIHRGNGTGSDADAGWEKAWRAACWAQLGNAEEFYHELTVIPVHIGNVLCIYTYCSSTRYLKTWDRTCLVCMIHSMRIPSSRLMPTSGSLVP
jgi:hypothetical protein